MTDSRFYSDIRINVGEVHQEKSFFKLKMGFNEGMVNQLINEIDLSTNKLVSNDDFSMYIRFGDTNTTLDSVNDMRPHLKRISNTSRDWDNTEEYPATERGKWFKVPCLPDHQEKQANSQFFNVAKDAHFEFNFRFMDDLQDTLFGDFLPNSPGEAKQMLKEGLMPSHSKLFENFCVELGADIEKDTLSNFQEDKDLMEDLVKTVLQLNKVEMSLNQKSFLHKEGKTQFLNDLITALWIPFVEMQQDAPASYFEDMRVVAFYKRFYVSLSFNFPGYGQWRQQYVDLTMRMSEQQPSDAVQMEDGIVYIPNPSLLS